ncbi:MAG: pseudouridylate synthase [Prevotella sp.]|nr:pseudouridylate synthase [Prevotella sp.]
MSNMKTYTEDFLRQIDVHELLPQQEPFVMIGTLTCFNEVRTVTETTISADNIFVDDGHFSASGLIENVAQTCAARIGFANKYILGNGITIGVIGAVRKLVINSLPAVGQTIVTTVDTVSEVFGMTLAKATVTCEGEELLTTEIKISVREG